MKADKVTVGWRLSRALMDKGRAKAKKLGVSITTYITMLLAKDLEK